MMRFSASVAARLMACPASADLAAAIPNWVDPVDDRTADNAANRGTRKHELLEPMMAYSAREIEQFARYLQYVADLRKTRKFKVLVEHEFTADWLQTQPKTKPDLVLYTQDELHILDGKWGKIPVEVHRNIQCMYYALCAAPLAPKAKKVTLHILQPQLDSYEKWEVTTSELKIFMQECQTAEADILGGVKTFGPGDHCTFCPANPHSRSAKGHPYCPAMLQILYPQPPLDVDEILADL